MGAAPASGATAVPSGAVTPGATAGATGSPSGAGATAAATGTPRGAGTTAAATGTPPGADVAPGTTATPPGAAPAAGAAAPRVAPAAGANGAPPAPSQETQALPALAAIPPAVPSVAADSPIGPAPLARSGSAAPLRQVAAAGVPRQRTPDRPASVAAEPQGRSRRSVLGIAAASLLALALVAFALTKLLGDSPTAGKKGAVTTKTDNTFVEPKTSSTATTAAVTPAVRGQSTVFVLNGSRANGLAAEVKTKLETSGYRSAGGATGNGTANAAVNTNAVTKVYFAPGKKRAAQDVAKQLSVSAANILAVDRATSIQAADADVVVLLGADKATG